MGNVLQGMEGQAPCRQATLGAGKYSFIENNQIYFSQHDLALLS